MLMANAPEGSKLQKDLQTAVVSLCKYQTLFRQRPWEFWIQHFDARVNRLSVLYTLHFRIEAPLHSLLIFSTSIYSVQRLGTSCPDVRVS